MNPDRQLLVQHILVPKDDEALLDSLANMIEDGADFGELAEAHSKCASGKMGGQIGWISPGRTEKPFNDAAFSAEVGALTKCTTRHGLHLLRVVEQRVKASIQQLAPAALKRILDAGEEGEHQWVDVREQNEMDISSLPHFQLYPLSSFNAWAPTIAQTLDPAKSTLVLCHHGVRSMQAADFLVSQGFSDVKNITGGIDRYSLEADSGVPRY